MDNKITTDKLSDVSGGMTKKITNKEIASYVNGHMRYLNAFLHDIKNKLNDVDFDNLDIDDSLKVHFKEYNLAYVDGLMSDYSKFDARKFEVFLDSLDKAGVSFEVTRYFPIY